MYLHIGEDILVKSNDIIVILDRYSFKNSDIFQEFMEKRRDSVLHLAKGEIKSIVITTKQVYLSPFSSSILKKRTAQYSTQVNTD